MGAAAILIYSDPAEDGYARGKVFPEGPWGPESHIQHGAITYDFIVPGDPQTPGWASVPGAMPSRCSKTWTAPKRRRTGRAACQSNTAWAARCMSTCRWTWTPA